MQHHLAILYRIYLDAILAGEKTTEYRSAATKIRGKVYIYASATLTAAEREAAAEYGISADELDRLPRGVIVGTVEITGCDGGDWYLANPIREGEPWKPTKRPNPVWFWPF